MAIQDDSSVALIPSAYGTSKVYSVIPSNGNGDFTFSRSGNATRVNKGGYIETMGSNVPRLDYPLIDGVVQDCPALLLEPSRTNKITYSEDQGSGTNWYTSSTWSVTTNTVISPDGSLSADTLTETTSNGYHSGYYNATIDASYTGSYTISAFLKKNGRNWFALSPKGASQRTFFNLENGTLGTIGSGCTAKIENYGNGWYRCSVTCSFSSEFVNFEHLLANTDGSLIYQGDGTSGVYIWGCQAEPGSYPTSYIPTSASTVTRSADECTDSGTSAEFNDSEGVLFVEALNPDGTDLKIVSLSDGGGTSNIVFIGFNDPTGAIYYYVISGGSTQSTFVSSITDINQYQRCAVKYKENDFALWVNGFEIHSDSSGITPTGLDEINFAYGTTSYKFHTKTKQLMTFKTALTDSELETLTSWDSFNAMAKGQLYTIE